MSTAMERLTQGSAVFYEFSMYGSCEILHGHAGCTMSDCEYHYICHTVR